jgi:hypothetical protein
MVKDHIHLGLDEDGDPVVAFETIAAARKAVKRDDSMTVADVVDYHPDVPVLESDEQETN